MSERPAELMLESHSPEETLQIGQRIGAACHPDTIITLSGNLGAGKTWLAKGIAYGLDVPDYEYVNSPAYDLVHEYVGRLTVYHLDLYRLDSLSTDDLLMIQEFYSAAGVCLIEWPSRLEKYSGMYPEHYLAIQITANSPDELNDRYLRLSAKGDQHLRLLNQILRNSDL